MLMINVDFYIAEPYNGIFQMPIQNIAYKIAKGLLEWNIRYASFAFLVILLSVAKIHVLIDV